MYILPFSDCSYRNKDLVGGKNSSLGELYHLSKTLGFNIADGFALTTKLYDAFIEQNNLDNFIRENLSTLDTKSIQDIEEVSKVIISRIVMGVFTEEQTKEIEQHYLNLGRSGSHASIAIRSSAIAEDLPNASFAGQQDTYLNIKEMPNIINHIKQCYGSLFNTRAISYRATHSIPYSDVKISVAVQKMVRSDLGSAGVAFLEVHVGFL